MTDKNNKVDNFKSITTKTALEQAEKNHEKITERFFEFLSYMFMAGLENPTETDAEFAKSLIEHVRRQTVHTIEMGQDYGYNPIINMSIWLKPEGVDGLDFQYKIDSIGGEVYERYNLTSLTQKLDATMGEWGKETFGADEANQTLISAWAKAARPKLPH